MNCYNIDEVNIFAL